MNDFIASLYDPWYNYESYKELLDSVYNAFDFQKLGISIIAVSLLLLIIFYKFWDPVKKPRLKWGITLLIVSVIMFCITYGILFSNVELLQIIGNYTGDFGEPNPEFFIFQMALYTSLYGIILSFVLSFLIKHLSVGNKHNPF
ncbi:hypothetical protein [Aestuariibaculum lutulentum]|uniref:Uncharacterized protein n=1 Tax=Aestuariibaculum lutulentum TaxID=2920935 RepID=A0ABS9RGY7_9FLAO|nr:hypothetical protein [Aestuariibaculum lutulentum]MCH4552212.1 hypothetical protein [Aestuariibaculum lutulentum]